MQTKELKQGRPGVTGILVLEIFGPLNQKYGLPLEKLVQVQDACFMSSFTSKRILHANQEGVYQATLHALEKFPNKLRCLIGVPIQLHCCSN